MRGEKRPTTRRVAGRGSYRVARMGASRARAPAPGGKDRISRLLEEWLAEAQIRYTYAGE